MSIQAGFSYSHSADYSFIDAALKARWQPYVELVREIESFVPRAVADFGDYRDAELLRLQGLNPNSTPESLLEYIDSQIKAHSDPGFQFYSKFSDRVMAEYVTVAFLAHALAEAAINAILAVGLAAAGAADLFSLIERADIKEKWVAGPKAFHPAYALAKGDALYQTLQHLTRQRNAFVHYKIELQVNGEMKLEGSKLDRAPLGSQLNWIGRFFSLPYDLATHARAQIPHLPSMLLFDSLPIERFGAHLRS